MKRHTVFLVIGLFLLPLFAAGMYILVERIQGLIRYDPSYFTEYYQELYPSSGAVASAIELALHNNTPSTFAELTGLRHKMRPPQANPDIHLMVALKVTDAGYHQYLFFNVKTYERIVYNVKEVDGRWVLVPRDPYYFLDSGDWLLFFTPAATIWWSLLAVISVGMFTFRLATRFREQLYHLDKN
jgi:hypothetical protein